MSVTGPKDFSTFRFCVSFFSALSWLWTTRARRRTRLWMSSRSQRRHQHLLLWTISLKHQPREVDIAESAEWSIALVTLSMSWCMVAGSSKWMLQIMKTHGTLMKSALSAVQTVSNAVWKPCWSWRATRHQHQVGMWGWMGPGPIHHLQR